MDIFLEPGETISLSDMVDGDMKYNRDMDLDIGFGCGSGRSSPLFASSLPDLWDRLDSSYCSIDPLDSEIMVDPAAIVPRRHTETNVILSSHHAKLKPREELLFSASESDHDEEEEVSRVEAVEDKKPLIKVKEEFTSLPKIEMKEEVLSPKSEVKTESNSPPPYVNGHKWNSISGGKQNRRDAARVEKIRRRQQVVPQSIEEFPKPAYSYSCLIAMALKNSPSGSLPVSEIYNFICGHFPYFKTALPGWKNSVRHNLSLNESFVKIEKSIHGGSRKGCLWALNPKRVEKMDSEVAKWSKKDPEAIKRAMKRPETLDRLVRGEMKICLTMVRSEEEDEDVSAEDEDDEPVNGNHNSATSEEESEQSEDEGEVPPSLKPFDRQLSRSRTTNNSDIGVEFTEEVYEELDLLEEVLEEAESIYIPIKRSRIDYGSYRHAIASHQ